MDFRSALVILFGYAVVVCSTLLVLMVRGRRRSPKQWAMNTERHSHSSQRAAKPSTLLSALGPA